MTPYKTGDSDIRNWGSYIVTNTEYDQENCIRCEKDITIKSGFMLSIQAHDHREERWMVKSGVLTVVLDGKIIELKEGEEIHIPKGAVHAMANHSASPCLVHEIQTGLCKEEDNHRYWDANNRPVEDASNENIVKSVILGKEIAEKLKKIA